MAIIAGVSRGGGCSARPRQQRSDDGSGDGRRASYDGVPRVIFSDPEIAAVGYSAAQARADGIDVATARVDLTRSLARPWTYEREPMGELELVGDRARGTLVGAWAVSALASEWIHQAAQAIRAHVPVTTLLDGIPQFPTYSEGFITALEHLNMN